MPQPRTTGTGARRAPSRAGRAGASPHPPCGLLLGGQSFGLCRGNLALPGGGALPSLLGAPPGLLLLGLRLGFRVRYFFGGAPPVLRLQEALGVLRLAEDGDPEVQELVGIVDGGGDRLGAVPVVSIHMQPSQLQMQQTSMFWFAFSSDETTPSTTELSC